MAGSGLWVCFMKKGRLFYRVSVGSTHGLKFTFNTLHGFHTLSSICGGFLGPNDSWSSKVKRSVCSLVPRCPLQFMKVHIEPPPDAGLRSARSWEMEKACHMQKQGPCWCDHVKHFDIRVLFQFISKRVAHRPPTWGDTGNSP